MSCGNVQDGPEGAEPEQVTMPRRKQVRRVDKTICQKCRQSKSMYIIRGVTYCKPCFETSVHTRIAKLLHPPLKGYSIASHTRDIKLLGGNRPNRLKGDVLFALSSGAGSTAMLELLVNRGYVGKGDGKIADKTKGEREVVWGKAWVVYVEFAGVLEGVDDRSQVVKEWVESLGSGLGWIGLKAEDVFDADLQNRLRKIGGGSASSNQTADAGSTNMTIDLKDPELPLFPNPRTSTSSTLASPLDQLRALVASLPPASRPALLSNVLSSLLTITAQTIPNVSQLLLGETSSRQAQRLIAGTASGRGWSLPLELSSVRKNAEGLMIMKPIKDLSTKEAAIYCHLKGLDILTRNERKWENAGPKGKRDARGKGSTASLEMLTEQFIASLSVTHPATVSTIIRTGDKLVFPGEADAGPSCPVCQLPVDPSALEWKSRTGLTSLPDKSIPSNAALTSIPEPTSSEAQAHDQSTLAPLLCYGCLTTFTPPTVVSKVVKGDSEPVKLPYWVGDNISRRTQVEVRRNEMRDKIKDFLLDGDDGNEGGIL